MLSARRGNIYHLTILLATIEAFKPSWNLFLLGGGRYRSRRHSCFVVDEHSVKQTPHRGHRDTLVLTYRAQGFLEQP